MINTHEAFNIAKSFAISCSSGDVKAKASEEGTTKSNDEEVPF